MSFGGLTSEANRVSNFPTPPVRHGKCSAGDSVITGTQGIDARSSVNFLLRQWCYLMRLAHENLVMIRRYVWELKITPCYEYLNIPEDIVFSPVRCYHYLQQTKKLRIPKFLLLSIACVALTFLATAALLVLHEVFTWKNIFCVFQ